MSQSLTQSRLEAIHPEPPDWPSVNRPFRALLLSLAGVALTLLALEGLARVLVDPLRKEGFDMFVLDAQVGWRFPAHQRLEGLTWFGKYHPELTFPTNNRGLRGTRDYPAPKPENQFRVICIGDSTTNNSYFLGYPEFLEELLAEALPEKDVWVQNAGVNGFSTENARRLARREIPLFDPDFVIISVGTDDALKTDAYDYEDYEVESFGDFLARVGQNSRLVSWLRRALPEWTVQPLSQRPTGALPEEVLTKTRTTPEMAQENYEAIVRVARREGASPILTLQPKLVWHKAALHSGAPYQPFPAWHEAVWQAAQDTQTPLLDGLALFDRPDRTAFFMVHESPSEDNIWSREWEGLYPDPLHLNEAGNRLLAAAYADLILDKLEDQEPGVMIDRTSIVQEFERWEDTPQATDDLITGVPPHDFAEYVSKLAQEANEPYDPKPWD